MSWKIESLVLAGFVLVLGIILAFGAVSYQNMSKYLENSELDAKSREGLESLALTLSLMEDADFAVRRYLVTGEKGYLTSYSTTKERSAGYFKLLRPVMSHNATQRTRLKQLEEVAADSFDSGGEAIQLRKRTNFSSVRHLLQPGTDTMLLEDIRQIVQEMEKDEKQSLRRRAWESTEHANSTVMLLSVASVLQFLLLGSVYYLIRHDVGERRRVATELENRGEQLEAANRELEAFSYSVSHDLRAPLRHIDGYVGLLEKGVASSLDDKARRYLRTISDSAKQMGHLIDELLVFSRMGRSEMVNTPVRLDQVFKQVLHDLRADIQRRNIAWTIGALPVVRADPAMVRQVVVNLISNALKYTSKRPQAKIEVGSRPGKVGEAVIFVRDNGVGFDMQYANKLFGVFQRLHRAEDFEGTGIGLANVRRIIHRHGGRTWAEGALDRGAAFYFTLPVHKGAA
ncbi:MAG: ATP-binding protein [Nitrospirales bacterium]